MPLKRLLIIFSLVGCANLPEKPTLELCLIDYPRQEVICGLTNKIETAEYQEVVDKIMAAQVYRQPLSYVDRGVSLRPPEWEKLENYRKALERYAREKCQE